jgi:uncharacterized protein YndB with AHSA1/START domain
LNRDLDRVKANNDAISRGESGEFGRAIKVEILIGRVSLQYLLNFRSHKFTTAVEQGIADAREWCRDKGIPCGKPNARASGTSLQEDQPDDDLLQKAYSPIISGGRFDPRIAPVAAHNELTIDAMPERIWEILVRAADWPRWYPNSRNVRIERDGSDLFPGAKFSWITFGICLRSVVQEFSPFARIAWNAKFLGVDAYHAWVIEPTARGCRVITEETQYGWLARTGDWLMPARLSIFHQLWLRRLALECAGKG